MISLLIEITFQYPDKAIYLYVLEKGKVISMGEERKKSSIIGYLKECKRGFQEDPFYFKPYFPFKRVCRINV